MHFAEPAARGPDAPVAPRDIVKAGLCIGCGSCIALAVPGEAAMGWNRYGQFEPRGADSWLRAPTSAFSRTCPFSPLASDETVLARDRFPDAAVEDPLIGRFMAAYVGHAAEDGFREHGSSGGMATWTARELLRLGLVDGVVHVTENSPTAGEPLFRYRVSRTEEDVRLGGKSRYYPVELSAVLDEMRAVPGRYAVVGIPCFIKAIHLLCRQDTVIRGRVAFTLGLFCGHMKSARMVESFAWQMGVGEGNVARIDYRVKDPTRPASWYRAQLILKDSEVRAEDWWNLADGDWGAGFFQNPACSFCDDVVAETADISFGDAWVEPYSSDGRGTNVVIARSPVLDAQLRAAREEGRVALDPVDSAFVVETQAAGLRQRREGLAYRLTWRAFFPRPRKRVAPCASGLPWRRKLVYRLRASISAWSHRVFWLARTLRMPKLYLVWARACLRLYQAVTYSRGGLGQLIDRIERRG
jgi:coenzyme F420-reducing hydrogenase beta subunit